MYVCLVICVASASVFHFSCAGIECAHCLRNADWREVAAVCSHPQGRDSVHFPRTGLCRPPRASIARGPDQDSLPSDHYEPSSSLVTLWVKKTTPELSPSSGPQSLGWFHSKTPWHSLCQVECPRRNSVHPLIWMNALPAPSSSNRSGSL